MDRQKATIEKTLFSVRELRWLLSDIKDTAPETRVKFRLSKTGWQTKFFLLNHVSDSSVVVLDETSNELKFLSFIDITQFTLNKSFNGMSANNHFDILLET